MPYARRDILTWQPGTYYHNYLERIGRRNGTLADRTFVRAWVDEAAAYRELVLDYVRGCALPEPVEQFLEDVRGW